MSHYNEINRNRVDPSWNNGQYNWQHENTDRPYQNQHTAFWHDDPPQFGNNRREWDYDYPESNYYPSTDQFPQHASLNHRNEGFHHQNDFPQRPSRWDRAEPIERRPFKRHHHNVHESSNAWDLKRPKQDGFVSANSLISGDSNSNNQTDYSGSHCDSNGQEKANGNKGTLNENNCNKKSNELDVFAREKGNSSSQNDTAYNKKSSEHEFNVKEKGGGVPKKSKSQNSVGKTDKTSGGPATHENVKGTVPGRGFPGRYIKSPFKGTRNVPRGRLDSDDHNEINFWLSNRKETQISGAALNKIAAPHNPLPGSHEERSNAIKEAADRLKKSLLQNKQSKINLDDLLSSEETKEVVSTCSSMLAPQQNTLADLELDASDMKAIGRANPQASDSFGPPIDSDDDVVEIERPPSPPKLLIDLEESPLKEKSQSKNLESNKTPANSIHNVSQVSRRLSAELVSPCNSRDTLSDGSLSPPFVSPSSSQRRIISELQKMGKNKLRELINNPRSRKVECAVRELMKEHRAMISKRLRREAESRIPTVGLPVDVDPGDESKLLVDFAIDWNKLPGELISTLGNLFQEHDFNRSEDETTCTETDLELSSQSIIEENKTPTSSKDCEEMEGEIETVQDLSSISSATTESYHNSSENVLQEMNDEDLPNGMAQASNTEYKRIRIRDFARMSSEPEKLTSHQENDPSSSASPVSSSQSSHSNIIDNSSQANITTTLQKETASSPIEHQEMPLSSVQHQEISSVPVVQLERPSIPVWHQEIPSTATPVRKIQQKHNACAKSKSESHTPEFKKNKKKKKKKRSKDKNGESSFNMKEKYEKIAVKSNEKETPNVSIERDEVFEVSPPEEDDDGSHCEMIVQSSPECTPSPTDISSEESQPRRKNSGRHDLNESHEHEDNDASEVSMLPIMMMSVPARSSLDSVCNLSMSEINDKIYKIDKDLQRLVQERICLTNALKVLAQKQPAKISSPEEASEDSSEDSSLEEENPRAADSGRASPEKTKSCSSDQGAFSEDRSTLNGSKNTQKRINHVRHSQDLPNVGVVKEGSETAHNSTKQKSNKKCGPLKHSIKNCFVRLEKLDLKVGVKQQESPQPERHNVGGTDNKGKPVSCATSLPGRVEDGDIVNPSFVFDGDHGTILDLRVCENFIFAGSQDGYVYMYMCSKECSGFVKRFGEKNNGSITCVAVGAQQGAITRLMLFTGSANGLLSLYKLKKRLLSDKNPPAYRFQISNSIQCIDVNWGYVYCGTKAGCVVPFQINTKSIKEPLSLGGSPVLCIKSCMEGPRKVLVMACRNQPIEIRDAMSGLLLRSIRGLDENITIYSLLLTSNLVYCGTSCENIFAFKFQNGELSHQLKAGKGIVCMKLFSGLLFASCYNSRIYIFDIKAGALVSSFRGPGNMVLCLDVDDNKIICASKNKQICAYRFPPKVKQWMKKKSRTPNTLHKPLKLNELSRECSDRLKKKSV